MPHGEKWRGIAESQSDLKLDLEGWGDRSSDRSGSIFKKALIESGPQRRFVKNEKPLASPRSVPHHGHATDDGVKIELYHPWISGMKHIRVGAPQKMIW